MKTERHLGNCAKHYREFMKDKSLLAFKGKTLDDETFEELIYQFALSAYSFGVWEGHRNAPLAGPFAVD